MNSCFLKLATCFAVFACLVVVLSAFPRLGLGQESTNKTKVRREMMTAWYAKDLDGLKNCVAKLEQAAKTAIGDKAFIDHYYAGLGRRQLASYSDVRADELNKAIVHLKSALKIKSDHADSHALLGNVYRMLIATGNHKAEWFAKAKEHREKAWDLDPDNPRVLLLEGSALVYIPSDRGGDIDAGIAFAFEAAGRFSIQNPKADITWGEADCWALIGAASRRKGKTDVSTAAFKRALKLQPNWSALKTNTTTKPKSSDQDKS